MTCTCGRTRKLVSIGPVTEEGDIEALRGLIQAHAEATGSPKAGRILANFGAWLPKFKKILPHDCDRMLRTIAWYAPRSSGPGPGRDGGVLCQRQRKGGLTVGKPTGFLEYARQGNHCQPPLECAA